TAALLEDRLVVGEASSAVQHLEIDHRARGHKTLLEKGSETRTNGSVRKTRQRALVDQVPSAQRHAPDITRGLSRSSPSICESRSAWRRRRAASTTSSSERLTVSFMVDEPSTAAASPSSPSSMSTKRLLIRTSIS